tara:strand:- start:21 stop:647 length:627 start_codon:yes stop_codon:yes gene_type:complete
LVLVVSQTREDQLVILDRDHLQDFHRLCPLVVVLVEQKMLVVEMVFPPLDLLEDQVVVAVRPLVVMVVMVDLVAPMVILDLRQIVETAEVAAVVALVLEDLQALIPLMVVLAVKHQQHSEIQVQDTVILHQGHLLLVDSTLPVVAVVAALVQLLQMEELVELVVEVITLLLVRQEPVVEVEGVPDLKIQGLQEQAVLVSSSSHILLDK